MDLQIGNNLKQLRRKKGVTQEELAAYLDISFQSISKWERGESYPEITMIIGIANYFEVSIDELVGREKFMSEMTLRDVFTKESALQHQGMYKEAKALLRDALKYHPNHYGLLSELALALANENESDQSLQEAIQLCKRIWEQCKSEKIRSTAVSTLCYLYRMTDDSQEATAVASHLPHIWESREMIWPDMLTGQEHLDKLHQSALTAICVLYHKISTAKSGDKQIPAMITTGPKSGGISTGEMLHCISEFVG